MPALNFQKQFVPLIESGEKRQTIRSQRKQPIKVGDLLYLYTGQRTKNCRKLAESICLFAHRVSDNDQRALNKTCRYIFILTEVFIFFKNCVEI